MHLLSRHAPIPCPYSTKKLQQALTILEIPADQLPILQEELFGLDNEEIGMIDSFENNTTLNKRQ